MLPLLLGMLAAIEFDNQALRDTAEIGEVRTDPVLSAKFESSQALGLEVLPQLPFLSRGPGTKPSRADVGIETAIG